MVKPIERVLRSGLFGPWDRPDIDGLDELPPGAQPGAPPGLGRRLVRVLPQLHAARSGSRTGTSPTTTGRRRTTRTSSRERCTSCRRRTPASGCSQELAAVTFKEYALQDGNTLEATQTMLESRAVVAVPAERPGDPASASPQDGPELRGRLPAEPRRRRSGSRPRPEQETNRHANPARRVRRPRALRRLVAGDRGASATPSDSRAPWTSSRRSTTPPSRGSTRPWPTSTSSSSRAAR